MLHPESIILCFTQSESIPSELSFALYRVNYIMSFTQSDLITMLHQVNNPMLRVYKSMLLL